MMMKNRIEWTSLDSIVKSDLNYYNINLDYEFDIVSKGTNVEPGKAGETYINDNLERALAQSGYELRLRFPEKNEYIKAQIGYVFISSIALLMLVCVSFILIYRFYKREKRLTGKITDFINNMTHEFKTPLTNIALANSMISKNEIVENDEKLFHYTGVIKNENQRLREKVDLLLKAALSETEQPLSSELFNAADEIRNVAGTFSVQIKEKNGRLQINVSGKNFNLSGNVELFQIAVGNLIDNAIRYNMSPPVIIITLESEKDTLMIGITDNGIGIKKEYIPRIFEKYFRISTGDVHNNEGFGLGLYHVKNTVEQMHGRIRVSSQVSKGTTFTLEFPLYKA
jgi:two-component system phosphate regulon sensor histidine kinase PhoR